MIERHLSNRRWITRKQLAQFSQVKRGPDPGRAKDMYERSLSSSHARRPDWVSIAALTFMVITWAGFLIGLWVIWAKCRGLSPF